MELSEAVENLAQIMSPRGRQEPNSHLPQMFLASVLNIVVTLTTVAGSGWFFHKEIMREVVETQEKHSSELEGRLIMILNSKLEKEPAQFKIDTQSEQLKNVETELKSTTEKILALDAKIEHLTQFMQRRER